MVHEQYKQARSIVKYFKEGEIPQVQASMCGHCDEDGTVKTLGDVDCRLEEAKDPTCG